MITSENILHLSGLVLTILISVNIINYTSKLIFSTEKIMKLVEVDQIYDPDLRSNISHICITSKDVYTKRFAESPCYNKTLLQWYNPWVRFRVWRGLWEKLEEKQRAKRMKVVEKEPEVQTESAVVSETPSTTEKPPPSKEVPEAEKKKGRPPEYFYSIVVGFLVMSVLAAFWEVFKDKVKGDEGAAAKVQDRQCSLADFTINRHLRRESQQQAANNIPRQGSLEQTAKVTQTLYHQSSLDRAFPKIISEVSSTEGRRNSVPAYPITSIHQGDKAAIKKELSSVLPLTRSKRQSVDVTSDETTVTEIKKKTRHFIRRH